MSEVSTTTQHITALDFDITRAEQQLASLQAKINQITQQIASQNWAINTVIQNQGDIANLRAQLEAVTAQYNQAQQEIIQMRQQMQDMSAQGITATSNLAAAIESRLVYALRNVASEAAETVKEVEASMTDISRVMQLSATETENLRSELFDLGQEYGRSFDDVSDISLRFAQAGYNMSDTISLTEDALLALNTAELDSEEATESLIGIINQWGMEAEDLSLIIDKLNYTADNNAVTTQDLIDGLLKASSMAKTAGMSFDETVGILTSMKVASGAAGKEVGNAFKSIMAYIQRPDSLKLFDDMGIDVYADKVTGELLPMMEILENMSEKWNSSQEEMLDTLIASGDAAQMMSEEWAIATDSLDEYTQYQEAMAEATDKANTAEARAQAQAAAGVYRRNYYIALMENLADAQRVTTELSEAEGHSMEENSRYMETLTAKIEQLVVSLKELAVTAADAGMLDLAKSAIDTATALTQWTVNTKTLIPLLGSLAGIMVTIKQKKLAHEIIAISSSFKNAKDTIVSTAKSVTAFEQSTNKATTSTKALSGAIGAAGLAFSAISAVIALANVAISKWHEKNEEAIETGKEVADSLYTLSRKYDEYAALSGVLEKTASQEETYKQLNEEIIELLGERAEALKGLKEGTEEYNTALENLIKEERIDQQDELAAATEAAKKELNLRATKAFGARQGSKDYSSAQTLLSDLNLIEDIGDYSYQVKDDGNGAIGYYSNLKKAKEALNEESARLIQSGKEEEAAALKASNTYKHIADEYDKVAESAEEYIQALVAEAENNYIIQNGLPKTYAEQVKMNDVIYIRTGLTEDYRDMVDSLVGTYYTATDAEKDFLEALKSSDFEQTITSMAKAGTLNTTVFNEILKSNSDFSQTMKSLGVTTDEAVNYLNELYGSAEDAEDGLDGLTDGAEMSESELEDLTKALSSAESSISSLNKYIQTLEEGNGLTAQQVLELVDTYGLLLDQFTLTEDGYKIEISALEQLREAQVKAAVTARESQIEQTEVLQTGLLDRIKAYGLEIESISNLAEAEASLLELEKKRAESAARINSADDYKKWNSKYNSGDYNTVIEEIRGIAEEYKNVEAYAEDFYNNLGKSFEKSKGTSEKTVDVLKEITEGYEHLVSLGIYTTEEQIAYYEKLRRTLDLTEEQYQSLESTLHKLYKTQLEESKEAIEAEYEAQKQAIEEQYELDKKNREEYWDNELDSLKESLNAQIDTAKKAYEQKKKLAEKSYDNQISALENLRDTEIDNINAVYDAQIDALEKIKAARQAERDEEDYQDERAELLEQISYYEQRTGTEAVEQLANLRKQLAELDKERQRELEDEEIDSQIDSLESQRDDELEQAKKYYNARIEALKSSQETELEMYEETYNREIELLEKRLETETKAMEKKRDEDLERLEDEKDAAIKAADDKWAEIEEIFEDGNLALIAAAGEFAPALYDKFHELFTEKFEMDLEELAELMKELEDERSGFASLSGTKPNYSASSSVSSNSSSSTQNTSGSSGGFSVGTQVKVSGTVYGDSYGGSPGASFDSKKTTITRINSSGTKPYHVGTLGWVDESQLVKARTGGKTTADGIAMLHKDELIINPPVTKMLEDLLERFKAPKVDIEAQKDAIFRYWGNEFCKSQQAMYQAVSNTYNNSNSNTDNHSKQIINNFNAPLQQIERIEDNADMAAAVNALERDLERQIAAKL